MIRRLLVAIAFAALLSGCGGEYSRCGGDCYTIHYHVNSGICEWSAQGKWEVRPCPK